MELSELLAELEGQPKFTHGIAVSAEQVQAIEDALSVQLPDQFRAFLQRFGFARWVGHSIYGKYELGSAAPLSYDFDLVRQTQKHRQRAVPATFASIAAEGLVIKKYEAGGFYFLFGKSSPRVGQVVLFEFQNNDSEVERWEDFKAFLGYLLGGITK